MIECALTKNILQIPIYDSQQNKSITSLSEVYQGNTIIYLNPAIGHLQTKRIKNLEDYYDKQYEIFNQSEEDDVLYNIVNGNEVFRQQHQIDTLLAKIEFKDGMKVLDYGCAKGTVMKRLLGHKPHIYPYLFDVSQMYTHLWDKFLPTDRYASYQPKNEWENSFDLVTSFFAFEHTPDPMTELHRVKNILKDKGLFYCVVPNIFENAGDFIVADHVHHYSELSLRYMFAQAGFKTISIDTESHFAAFIIIGQKIDNEVIEYKVSQTTLVDTNQKYLAMADYWENLRLKIQEFERTSSNLPSAIYGAGIYGNFIATCLQNFDNVEYFIDRNPLLKGKEMMKKPILSPDELPSNIATLYIGLNPKIAQTAIASINKWDRQNHKYFFL
jgi:cyclopropane fatty-acyl-phospholipid synthase-like methyltransferase